MARRRSIWVLPDGDVWIAKKEGASKASAIRNTKEEAYQAARNIALNQNLDIIIKDANNKIQKRLSPREARDNNCFITTACVKYYGLKDNCYQLEILRKFRDGYLLKSDSNKDLVLILYCCSSLS